MPGETATSLVCVRLLRILMVSHRPTHPALSSCPAVGQPHRLIMTLQVRRRAQWTRRGLTTDKLASVSQFSKNETNKKPTGRDIHFTKRCVFLLVVVDNQHKRDESACYSWQHPLPLGALAIVREHRRSAILTLCCWLFFFENKKIKIKILNKTFSFADTPNFRRMSSARDRHGGTTTFENAAPLMLKLYSCRLAKRVFFSAGINCS